MNCYVNEPKIIVSLRRRVNEQSVSLAKSEQTIRSLQLEIDRLKQKLAEAQSAGASQ